MKHVTLFVFACLASLTLACASADQAQAGQCNDDSAPLAAKLFDGIIVRPVGVALATATSAVYIGTSPLTFLMNVDEPAANVMVSQPWRLTAGRPLGKF